MEMEFGEDSFEIDIQCHRFFFLYGTQNNDSLHFHGKLESDNGYKSCTIVIKPVIKTLFAKTKDDIVLDIDKLKELIEHDLHTSIKGLTTYFSEIVEKQSIYNNKKRKYLKINVQLPEQFYFDNNNIPEDSCIDYVYGLRQNALEQFLIEKNIKGPCWLQIETYNETISNDSMRSTITCHPNGITTYPEAVPSPSLKIIILDCINVAKTDDKLEPIALALGFCIWNGKECVHERTKVFAVMEKQSNRKDNSRINFVICENSSQLVQSLHKILSEEDVDILFCDDERKFLHVSNWHSQTLKNLFARHVLMDARRIAQELFPRLLADEGHRFDRSTDARIANVNELTADVINRLVDNVERHVRLANETRAMSAYMLLSNVCGCSFQNVASCGQLKRAEEMLRYELHRARFVIPEACGRVRARAQKIIGGKIIEPVVDIFNNLIVSLDFKSLYPSIIREYDLSFTDGDRVLPRLMDRLVVMREELQREERRREEANNRSTTVPLSAIVKMLANSVYGCLSSAHSSFYHPHLAQRITKHGRDLLAELQSEMPRELECVVISGQTDSIFAELCGRRDVDEALRDVRRYQEVVNARRRHVALKLDGVYSHGIVFSKQAYALKRHESHPGEYPDKWLVKGILRNTTSRICKRLFRSLLERVVAKRTRFERTNEFLLAVHRSFAGEDWRDYVAHVQLHNPPAAYEAHTAYGSVVQRKNVERCHGYRQFDVVSYVVCLDGTSNRPHARAYDVEEVERLGLRVDKGYYKAQHLVPLVARICDIAPQRVDADKILACLTAEPEVPRGNVGCLAARYKYERAAPFRFRCLTCWRYVVLNKQRRYDCFLKCCLCDASLLAGAQADEIRAAVENTIREHRRKLSYAKRLTLASGAADSLACLETRFRRQMRLWREVVLSAQFTLEWCSSDRHLPQSARASLADLFRSLLLLLEANSGPATREVIDFSDYFAR